MRARNGRQWRRLRLLTLVGACALLAGTAISAMRQAAASARVEITNMLRQSAQTDAAVVSAELAHAAEVTLLLARSPALRRAQPVQDEIDGALADVQTIGRTRMLSAALVEADGRLFSRVTGGTPAGSAERARSAADLRHLEPTLELAEGAVRQSTPYRSPSGEWVVATSTQITPAGGRKARILVTETGLTRLRTLLGDDDPRVVSRIVTGGGEVVVNSRIERRAGEPVGPDSDRATLRRSPANGGALVAEGQAFDFRPVASAPGNENTWTVVTSAPAAGNGSWLRAGGAASAMALATLLLLGLGVMAIRRHGDDLEAARITDPLTGLPNRSALAERGEEVLARDRAGGTMTGVLLLNLYQFRAVNDALDHRAGDRIITEIAERLRGVLRDGDLLVRIGGDEFAMLLARVENTAGAQAAAERVLTALHPPFVHEDTSVGVHAVVGGALSPQDGDNIHMLIKRAGVALYAARRRGSALMMYRAGLETTPAGHLSLISDLRQALESDQLELHYQPKVDLRTGTIGGVEALIRWNHPRLGQLMPMEFIPLAEETGLIHQVTRKVINLALAQSRAWLDEGLELPIAVNLSTRCIQERHTVDTVSRALTRWQVPPRLLELEITETSVVHDADEAMTVLEELDALGVTLSVDDYGTGYSSLTSIRNLPVREIKIDRMFLEQMISTPDDQKIVRSTVELGHRLGMRVVAEGVEDADAVRALMALGCDTAQGNFFCEPLAPDELRRWLLSRNSAQRAAR